MNVGGGIREQLEKNRNSQLSVKVWARNNPWRLAPVEFVFHLDQMSPDSYDVRQFCQVGSVRLYEQTPMSIRRPFAGRKRGKA
jgi:hypothetical protein